MGVYYDNYLGAYLAVKTKKSVVPVKVWKCLKCKTSYARYEHTFCPDCGEKITEDMVDTEKTVRFTHYNYEEWEDDLRSPEYPNSDEETYSFPNGDSDAEVDLGFDYNDDCGIYDINDTISPGVYIAAFKEEFAGILLEIEKDGFEYEIRFGFVRMGS